MHICLVCFDTDGPGSCARCGVERLPAERPEVRDEIYARARRHVERTRHRADVIGGAGGAFAGFLAWLALVGNRPAHDLPLFGSHRLLALMIGLGVAAGVGLARRLRPPIDVDSLQPVDAARVISQGLRVRRR